MYPILEAGPTLSFGSLIRGGAVVGLSDHIRPPPTGYTGQQREEERESGPLLELAWLYRWGRPSREGLSLEKGAFIHQITTG